MRVQSVPANEGETFPCSRKLVEMTFGNERLDYVSFGAIGRRFQLDTRARQRPTLLGIVTASLSFAPRGAATLCLYPVDAATYQDAGKTNFAEVVLPHFSQWLAAQHLPPAVAISSHRQILAEWTGAEHRFHELQYLYQPS